MNRLIAVEIVTLIEHDILNGRDKYRDDCNRKPGAQLFMWYYVMWEISILAPASQVHMNSFRVVFTELNTPERFPQEP